VKYLFLLVALSLTGCSENRKEYGAKGELDLTVYKLKGRELDCIVSGYQLTCNWEKYNKLIAECEDKRLKEREYYDKDGKRKYFPAVKGECE